MAMTLKIISSHSLSICLIVIVSVTLMLLSCATMQSKVKSKNELPDLDILWNYGDPAETEQDFIALVPEARKAGNESYYGQLLTQIARARGLQMKFNDAQATLDEVKPLLETTDPLVKIRYYLELGRVYNSSKLVDKARPCFITAWEWAVKEKQDFYAVDAAHMMGIVEQFPESVNWNEKALAIAEKSEDKRCRAWKGPLYNNTAWSYFENGNYDRAQELFTRDIAWREESKDAEGKRIATWSRARTLRALGKVEQALEIQQTIMSEMERDGLAPDGYVFEEIGECLLQLKKSDESHPFFQKAYNLLKDDPWLSRDEPERLNRLKKLGTPD